LPITLHIVNSFKHGKYVHHFIDYHRRLHRSIIVYQNRHVNWNTKGMGTFITK
jgi:hypothetical protein